MRAGINYVDKDDFLEHYIKIRPAVYTSSIIQSGFRVAGLVPFNPEEVISKLDIRLRTPSPIRSLTQSPRP
jgi:hypothetical protein